MWEHMVTLALLFAAGLHSGRLECALLFTTATSSSCRYRSTHLRYRDDLSYFKVPGQYQHECCLGYLSASERGLFIGMGALLIERFG